MSQREVELMRRNIRHNLQRRQKENTAMSATVVAMFTFVVVIFTAPFIYFLL